MFSMFVLLLAPQNAEAGERKVKRQLGDPLLVQEVVDPQLGRRCSVRSAPVANSWWDDLNKEEKIAEIRKRCARLFYGRRPLLKLGGNFLIGGVYDLEKEEDQGGRASWVTGPSVSAELGIAMPIVRPIVSVIADPNGSCKFLDGSSCPAYVQSETDRLYLDGILSLSPSIGNVVYINGDDTVEDQLDGMIGFYFGLEGGMFRPELPGRKARRYAFTMGGLVGLMNSELFGTSLIIGVQPGLSVAL